MCLIASSKHSKAWSGSPCSMCTLATFTKLWVNPGTSSMLANRSSFAPLMSPVRNLNVPRRLSASALPTSQDTPCSSDSLMRVSAWA